MFRLFTFAALALAVSCLALAADERRPVDRKEFKTLADNPLDREFLIAANVCCNADMEYAKLADKRSERADVKAFAKELVEDHKKGCQKIADVLKDRKLAIVVGKEKHVQEHLTNLGKLSNANFDRAFLSRIVADHQEAIKAFENQVAKGEDKAITTFARECLPMLKKHLAKAKELQAKK